jgi:hypothetical protein
MFGSPSVPRESETTVGQMQTFKKSDVAAFGGKSRPVSHHILAGSGGLNVMRGRVSSGETAPRLSLVKRLIIS